MAHALWLRLFLFGSTLCAAAMAQTQVEISGRVLDPMGSVLSEACVTVKAAGSTNKFSMLTNSNGEYLFGGLLAGTYDLSFTWRFRPYDNGTYKPRSFTFKANDPTNVVPPVTLETGQTTIDYDYDALQEYRPTYMHGSWELHASCTLNLNHEPVECPGVPERGPASERKDHYLRLESDGQRLYLVPLHGVELALGCSESGYSTKRLRIDNLPEKNLICGKTSKGRRAELSVGFKDVCVPGSVIIFFQTKFQ